MDNLDFKHWLTEATREYVKSIIDPALMTYEEYYKMVNPSCKHHPDDAYSSSVSDNEYAKGNKDKFKEKIKTIKSHGIEFEFRLKKEDRVSFDYVKKTPEGEIIRDEKGIALSMSHEDKMKRFKDRRYEYSVGVFTKDDGWVGGSQDEWGCMLIRVVDEYQGFGLGTEIGKIARKYDPGKDSGGFTPSGERMLRRVHSEYVREYMQSGFYSHLVKTGQITTERAKKIIDSISPASKRDQKNLGSSDPKDWLIYANEDNIIVYDKKIKDLINDENDFFKEKMIKGSIFARASGNYYRIVYFGGESDQIKKQLMTICAVRAKYYNVTLAVEIEDEKYLDKSQIDIIERDTVKPGYKSHIASYKGRAVNTDMLGLKEKQFRASFDKHGEFEMHLTELAYGKYRNN